MKRVLAFDLGASSGRAMLGTYEDGKIEMTELHRFSNDPVETMGTLYWDTLRLFYNIKVGITKAVNDGGFDSVGIDTWGVDFGLIGKDGQMIDNPVHYRDKRTDGFESFVISPDEMYEKTGIQYMQINTVYQLDALLKSQSHIFDYVDKVLFTPDLLNYFLTGEMKAEYTVASTSALLNAQQRDWEEDIINRAGFPREIFCDMVMPGNICGELTPEIQEELHAPAAKVINIASHDTASAVVSMPTQEKDFIFISSGTWSLLGTEIDEPLTNEMALKYNFANEGGYDGKIRFLKNIMGTWLIQESRRQWRREGSEYSYGELESLAKECEPFRCFVDVDHPDFATPGNMPRRVKEHCERSGQYVPQTPGEIVRCIDESLALKYKYAILGVQECTGLDYKSVNIVGGGVNSKLLCQMTADASGKKVIAGPTEATVLGNIAVQLAAQGVLNGLSEIRRVIANSVTLDTYEPQDTDKWEKAYQTYVKLIEE